ncbi:uncharacterized protein [Rutidosis leptorrhynchoides]|uniref:uncharacterized protein n=1 Tax=Rutidosis leptorrhynchoides TaxID=125765 RepID=UPI003A98FC50
MMSRRFREPSVKRRQPLLQSRSFYSSASTSTSSSSATSPSASPYRASSYGFAEVAGGTTAECAAICCCCPCGLANFLILAMYKLPAGLCRNAIRNKRRKRLIKKGLVPPLGRQRCRCGCDETELQIHSINDDDLVFFDNDNESNMELEKEMWDKFYETGFWRSPSQRERQ